MQEDHVGVFGAYGHTGRFVAAELKRRGLNARWIGRDLNALCQLKADLNYGDVCIASIDDPASLQSAFAGLDAVINCAGPFIDTSRPVIAAALQAGCHVVDITAEQVAVIDTFASFDSMAKAAGRVVLPAMGFFGGLADLLASSIVKDWPEVDSIDIAVALDFWHPTAGTRLTGARNTATRMLVRDGALNAVPSPSPTAFWRFPDPFGEQAVMCVVMSEIVLMSQHIKADMITTWMTMKPLSDLGDKTTPPPTPQDAHGRSGQMFAMSARAQRSGIVRNATVTGRDIYAATAPLVVEACARLLCSATSDWAGVKAPAEVFDANEFMAAIPDTLTLTQMDR
jgi:short subunit dehydrogenase-like uncharacterized protein